MALHVKSLKIVLVFIRSRFLLTQTDLSASLLNTHDLGSRPPPVTSLAHISVSGAVLILTVDKHGFWLGAWRFFGPGLSYLPSHFWVGYWLYDSGRSSCIYVFHTLLQLRHTTGRLEWAKNRI